MSTGVYVLRNYCAATATAEEEPSSSKMMMETLEELEWCLEQLETIQTHKSVSDMATSKVRFLTSSIIPAFKIWTWTGLTVHWRF